MIKTYFVILFALLCTAASAQQLQVRGLISDQKNGKPIPFVSVAEKGTTNGTTTDENGKYQLTVASGSATLVFSVVGFDKHEENINGRTEINYGMTESLVDLDEFVVTALGTKRATENLGYAIQKIDSKTVSEVKSPQLCG